jgi:hypothetical protein
MTRDIHLAPIVVLMSIASMSGSSDAAGIYQCTQADGSITLSDSACPPETLTREYRGEATASGRPQSPSKDPWSVINQVRRIEKRDAAERKAATGAERHARKTDGAKAPASDRPRKLSYPEAHRKALEATGYNEDSQLSEAQRERLGEELAKYGYGLREPAKKSTHRKSKAKTQGAGEATTAAPKPATAVDPRNASLTHRPDSGSQSANGANGHE